MPTRRRASPAPPFDSIYRHGFVRVAVATPRVEVASPAFNATETLDLARKAADARAVLAVFPELGLSAYSNEDLFHQDALLDASLDGLAKLLEASRELPLLLAAGLPLRAEGRLYNCAVLMQRGRLLGVVPKTYLPNYREFYEKRHFASAEQTLSPELPLLGQQVPFGNRLLFRATNLDSLVLHLEICEDLWVPVPPSTLAALGGATVLVNLSASDITVGKADYRRLLCASQSAKCVAAYLYSAAGPGESTTDLAWDGHALVYENGERIAESLRFPLEGGLVTADVDLDHLRQERTRLTSFADCARTHSAALAEFRIVDFELELPGGRVPLERRIERFPYVPAEHARRDERCAEVYDIQVEGLMKRLSATGIGKVVIGISGGLDSTQAALVAVRAFDRLRLPRSGILGYTLPGFGTSRQTLGNARALMKALGITAGEIDIRPASSLMLGNIGHPHAGGREVYDVTFENVQAGERTSVLFRLANLHGGLVLGTGDLSELALGFTTYGVGDHMSHYNVNASVPKTLIRHLIRWLVQTKQFDARTLAVLTRIVETRISPELVPGSGEEPDQSSEAVVGPYELQDFHL
ncbi:MAG TPA: NAD(+) synthase, partial [Steroidobacteraceae bacterium]|nr:NAD(+) synthase [Steroidobacteraceae bacterium]